MYDHYVFDPAGHELARLKEELGLAAADLLSPVLRLPVFAQGGLDHAILLVGKHYDVDLLHQVFLGIEDVDIFHGFVNQPFLTS